jgi:hypothetical protein
LHLAPESTPGNSGNFDLVAKTNGHTVKTGAADPSIQGVNEMEIDVGTRSHLLVLCEQQFRYLRKDFIQRLGEIGEKDKKPFENIKNYPAYNLIVLHHDLRNGRDIGAMDLFYFAEFLSIGIGEQNHNPVITMTPEFCASARAFVAWCRANNCTLPCLSAIEKNIELLEGRVTAISDKRVAAGLPPLFHSYAE